VRVAGLQLDIVWETPAENFRRADALAGQAADSGARLLALPEMFATGFSMRADAMASYALEIREFLADLATRHQLWVIGGFAEPGEKRPANSCGVFGPDGREILHYRKIHSFSLADEQEHYEAGDQIGTVEIEGVRFWGSPWQPWFFDWAFNLERGEEIRAKWELIPDDTEVLITHGPPQGHGDMTSRGEGAGCADLLARIRQVKPRYHLFGHIHEGYGTSTDGVTSVSPSNP